MRGVTLVNPSWVLTGGTNSLLPIDGTCLYTAGLMLNQAHRSPSCRQGDLNHYCLSCPSAQKRKDLSPFCETECQAAARTAASPLPLHLAGHLHFKASFKLHVQQAALVHAGSH